MVCKGIPRNQSTVIIFDILIYKVLFYITYHLSLHVIYCRWILFVRITPILTKILIRTFIFQIDLITEQLIPRSIDVCFHRETSDFQHTLFIKHGIEVWSVNKVNTDSTNQASGHWVRRNLREIWMKINLYQ